MGLPPYGPEPYASANSATPAQLGFLSKRVNMIPQLIDHDKKKIHTGEISHETRAKRGPESLVKTLGAGGGGRLGRAG